MSVQATLSILSLEDEPDAVDGSVEYLEMQGHSVERAERLEPARDYLRSHPYDLIFLDERLKEHDRELRNGGSTLIVELKSGDLGALNIEVPFVFVTGNEIWVDRKALGLPGFRGIEVKGGGLTKQLNDRVSEVLRENCGESKEELMRRAPLVVVSVSEVDPDIGGGYVHSIIPAWDNETEVRFPLALLPLEFREEPENLPGSWFFVQLNLGQPDPTRLVLQDFEIVAPLEDDHELA